MFDKLSASSLGVVFAEQSKRASATPSTAGDTVYSLSHGILKTERVVKTGSGSVYTFKTSSGDTIKASEDDLEGLKSVTASDWALTATLKCIFAAEHTQFDMYIKEAIKQAGLPVDPKMRWSGWLNTRIISNISRGQDDVVVDALYSFIVEELFNKKLLETNFDPSRITEDIPLEHKVTAYLMNMFLKKRSYIEDTINEGEGNIIVGKAVFEIATPDGPAKEVVTQWDGTVNGRRTSRSVAIKEVKDAYPDVVGFDPAIISESWEKTDQTSKMTHSVSAPSTKDDRGNSKGFDIPTTPTDHEWWENYESLKRFREVFFSYLDKVNGGSASGIKTAFDLYVEFALAGEDTNKTVVLMDEWTKRTGLTYNALRRCIFAMQDYIQRMVANRGDVLMRDIPLAVTYIRKIMQETRPKAASLNLAASEESKSGFNFDEKEEEKDMSTLTKPKVTVQKKAAVNKYAKLQEVAKQAKAVSAALTELSQFCHALGSKVSNIQEHLELTAPATPKTGAKTSLRQRLADRSNYGAEFVRMATEEPAKIEEAINEVYSEIDELGAAIEAFADNTGLDLVAPEAEDVDEIPEELPEDLDETDEADEEAPPESPSIDEE